MVKLESDSIIVKPAAEIMDQIQCVACEEWYGQASLREVIPGDPATLTCDNCIKQYIVPQFTTRLLNEDNGYPELVDQGIDVRVIQDILGEEFMRKWWMAVQEWCTLPRRRRYCTYTRVKSHGERD